METMSELAERLYQDLSNKTPHPQMTLGQLDDFLNNARDRIAEDCRIPKHLLFDNPDYKHSDEHLKLPDTFTRRKYKSMPKFDKIIVRLINKVSRNIYLHNTTKPRFKKRMMKGN